MNDAIINGVVEGQNGPEAGVWVIAETDALGTGFVKIVVTDDDGRFVLPQLPDASYDVWVRGYGLADSEPVAAETGWTSSTPLGFYSRGLDGRIDDPDAGWKGRGVWADFGTNIPWHLEGGAGTTSKIVKFQIRPDPLAY